MKATGDHNYSHDPYTVNIGSKKISEALYKRYGERYTSYREEWVKTLKLYLPDFPLNLGLSLMDKCTLSCPQCLRSDRFISKYDGFLGTNKVLPYDMIIKALDEGYQYGLPSISIGGIGEDLLHPDFIKICSAIMDRDVMELRIGTNGTFLSDEVIETLIENQVHVFSVSIDAFTKETFKKVRGKESMLQTVVDNTLRFRRMREKHKSVFPLLRVTYVLQPNNKSEVKDFTEFWAEYADMIDIQAYMDYGATTFNKDFDCSESWNRLMIYPDNRVGPCCGFPGIEYEVGRINETTLFEIWHGEKIKSIREMVKSKAYKKPCLICNGTRVKLE